MTVAKGDMTRARVLAAAAECFREQGLAAVRFSDIAGRVGLRAGSLYFHFDSRDELVREVVHLGHQRILDAVRQALDALPVGSGSADHLRSAIGAHVREVGGDHSGAAAALLISWQASAGERHLDDSPRSDYLDLWSGLLHRCVADGHVRPVFDEAVVGRLLVGALDSVAEWCRPEPARPTADRASAISSVLIDGAAVSRAAARRRPHTSEAPQHEVDVDGPRHAATRQRILEAAASVFVDQGYASTRLVDIAERSGMKTGSLYYHFSSREALVQEALSAAIAEAHEAFEYTVDQAADRGGLDQVEAAINTHLRTIWRPASQVPALVRIFSAVPESVRAAVEPGRAAYSAAWIGLLERTTAAREIRSGVDERDLFRLLNGAMNHTVDPHQPEHADPDRLALAMTELFLHGLLIDSDSKSA